MKLSDKDSGTGARGLVSLWFAWFAAASAPVPLLAQTVQGTVLDAETGDPIYTVEVTLLGTDDEVVARTGSTKSGVFALRAPDRGSYRLRAARIGYRQHTSDEFTLEAGQEVVADLRLEPEPIALAPIEAVVKGRQLRRLKRVGFCRRQDIGFGTYMTAEDIEKRSATEVPQLLHGVPGARVVGREPFLDVEFPRAQTSFSGRCLPSVSIDGDVVRRGGVPTGVGGSSGGWSGLVHPTDIEAMEVYPRP